MENVFNILKKFSYGPQQDRSQTSIRWPRQYSEEYPGPSYQGQYRTKRKLTKTTKANNFYTCALRQSVTQNTADQNHMSQLRRLSSSAFLNIPLFHHLTHSSIVLFIPGEAAHEMDAT